MTRFYKDNISLSEALTMELPDTTRVWDVDGLQVEYKDIPKKAVVSRTFVQSHMKGSTSVEIMFTVAGKPGVFIDSVAVYPEFDLEKLKKDFPNLFKLTGSLCAYDK